MTRIGYALVALTTSTPDADSRRRYLLAAGVHEQDMYLDIVTETTRTPELRPSLYRLLQRITEADTLIIERLERLAVSETALASIMGPLIDAGPAMEIGGVHTTLPRLAGDLTRRGTLPGRS